MAIDLKKISSLYMGIDTHISVHLLLEGDKYEIERFNIVFGQPTDHKGQPQHEVKGGQFIIALSQMADDILYDWAKRSKKEKNGIVAFSTEMSGTILEIDFTDASCISLVQKVNAFSGTETLLVIAPRKIRMNKYTHDNHWRDR